MLDFLTHTRSPEGMEIFVRLLMAALVGALIGVEREYKNRPAGMRTHTLVCLGAATIALLESLIRLGISNGMGGEGVAISVGRMSAQVISGIGFLGAGTIFMAQKKIAGLTTAASLWMTCCLGLVIGFGYYGIALVNSIVVIIVLTLLQRIIRVNALKKVEIQFIHRAETINYISQYFAQHGIKVLDVDFRIETLAIENAENHNVYTNIYVLHLPHKADYSTIVNHLSEHPNVQMIRTRNT